MSAKEKFWVELAEKIVSVDNYEKGEDPNTTVEHLWEGAKSFYHSIEELAGATGLSDDLDYWEFDDGILYYSQLEDEDGNFVSTGSFKYKEFENGEIDLYACTYTFYIKFIEGIYTPSKKEIEERFKK